MKLSVKLSGMSASLLVGVVIVTGLANQHSPFDTLMLALFAGSVGGALGYQIGNQLARPKNKPSKGKAKGGKAALQKKSVGKGKSINEESATESANSVGELEEATFLDDLPQLEASEPPAQ